MSTHVFAHVDRQMERLSEDIGPTDDGTGRRFNTSAHNASAERASKGDPTWAELSRDSFYAALKESDRDVLRQRLTDHAAVICLWLEALDL